MNISKLKIAWAFITGGKAKVLDYCLDIANNAVNRLDDSSKENIAKVLAAVKKIIATAKSVEWLVPSKWLTSYRITLDALADVQMACEDLRLTPNEMDQVVASWQRAYAAWRAE